MYHYLLISRFFNLTILQTWKIPYHGHIFALDNRVKGKFLLGSDFQSAHKDFGDNRIRSMAISANMSGVLIKHLENFLNRSYMKSKIVRSCYSNRLLFLSSLQFDWLRLAWNLPIFCRPQWAQCHFLDLIRGAPLRYAPSLVSVALRAAWGVDLDPWYILVRSLWTSVNMTLQKRTYEYLGEVLLLIGTLDRHSR